MSGSEGFRVWGVGIRAWARVSGFCEFSVSGIQYLVLCGGSACGRSGMLKLFRTSGCSFRVGAFGFSGFLSSRVSDGSEARES